jgi:DNA invertase Pin-like site-specific DNA recombinase
VKELALTGEDNAMANLLLNVMGAFAEFERSLIRERQREGIALAKTRGVYQGRTRSLDAARAAELREKAAAGVPKAALARDFGINRETVYAYLRADG